MNSEEAKIHFARNMNKYNIIRDNGMCGYLNFTDWPLGTGSTWFHNHMVYGCVGLPAYAHDGTNCSEIDINEFVDSLVTIHHEGYHVEQFADLFQNPDEDTRKQAESYLSKFASDDVYEHFYNKFSFEIMAEHTGVTRAYEYIRDNVPELEAEGEILKYIQRQTQAKRESFPYFLEERDYKSVDDVSEAFDTAYAKSYKEIKPFLFYEGTAHDVFDEMPGLYHAFSLINDGEEQTRAVVCVIGTYDPNIYEDMPMYKNLSRDFAWIYDYDATGRSLEMDKNTNYAVIKSQESLIYEDKYDII